MNQNMEIQEDKFSEVQSCKKCGWGEHSAYSQSEEQVYSEICPNCRAETVWINSNSASNTISQELLNGESSGKIIARLVRDGHPHSEALQIVHDAADQVKAYKRTEQGRLHMSRSSKSQFITGIAMVILGIGASIGLSFVTQGYVLFLFWGLIVFGLFSIIRGLSGLIGWIRYSWKKQ